jgi:hypothetical protein
MSQSPAARPATRNPQFPLLIAALAALYVGARLWGLTESCLWFDELFGVHAARHDWAGLWRFAAADLIHPPLFYALLKVWVGLGGESPFWLRLFPFAASAAAVAPFLLLARELRLGRAETCLALLLAAASGFLIKYAQEVRMYALLLLLSLTSLWLLARYAGARGAGIKTLLALTLANLLLVYSHYYGWLVVACEAGFLLWRARARLTRFALSTAAVALCFAPWVYACWDGARAEDGLARNVAWIERPSPADAAGLYALIQQPFYFQRSSEEPAVTRAGVVAGLVLVTLPVVLLIIARRRRDEDGAADDDGRAGAVGFLLYFSLAPPALAFVASHLLPQSVWGTRHLIVAAGPYLLLAGAGLARLRPTWAKATVLTLLACWLFLAGAGALLRREVTYVWCAWEGLAASVEREERGARVFAFEDLVAYHLWFALGEESHVAVVRGVPGITDDPGYFLPRRFGGVGVTGPDSLDAQTFWVAFRAEALDETRPPLATLRERGYRVARVHEAGARRQHAFLVQMVKE